MKIKDIIKVLENSKKEKHALVLSRNDTFKKTDLYFKEFAKVKGWKFDFVDWFKDYEYKKEFMKKMPKNCRLVPKINKALIPMVLKGYDAIYCQNSGLYGVSELEAVMINGNVRNIYGPITEKDFNYDESETIKKLSEIYASL